ncbi:protein F37C4.5-like isoform X4 [Clytia hemisphaerica]|uniref:protein F37C4.5-like isoform X4 n=1 Tax=Clytia hemisphaerica TaxID=252671 RepID=UPI0034D77EEC
MSHSDRSDSEPEDLEQSVSISKGKLVVKMDQTIKKSESSATSTKEEVQIKDCPVKNVTVFVDRAEVNRIVDLNLQQGNVEVLLKDLPDCMDQDSMRVSCFGEATIVEVAYQEKAVKENGDDCDDSEQIKSKTEAEKKNIKGSIKTLEANKAKHEQRIEVINKEKLLLQNYADCISSKKEDKVGDVLEKKSIENMLNFLAIYEERSTRIHNEFSDLTQKIEEIVKEIGILKQNLVKLEPKTQKTNMQRNVSILLEVKEESNVNLVASYVVSRASWRPFYDVRAFNKDSSVQILYFGMIRQNTGEDWEDAKLSLSTALPSVGGSPPSLKPQLLKVATVLTAKSAKRPALSFRRHVSNKIVEQELQAKYIIANSMEKSIELSDYNFSQAPLPIAEATENLTSTNFDILRPSTIESDDVEHKVSICQLDFSPEFEYLAIPKSVAHAFLKIKVKNDSNYALLAGDANVFLDNNFLTKTTLSAVSPMEEFDIALGVDPSVKVTYKPVKKFQQRTGMISKADLFNFHQVIEIKNTKSLPVKIKVTDQCPWSTNDKIKITLQDPDIKFPKGNSSDTSIIKNGNASLYTNNNTIEWELEVPSSETKTINLKYQVEHPIGVRIEGL